MSNLDRKYQIDTEKTKIYEEVRKDLFDFGRKFPSPGGSAYYLGDDGTPWKEKNRETYVTCRMAHVYSMAHFLRIRRKSRTGRCSAQRSDGRIA